MIRGAAPRVVQSCGVVRNGQLAPNYPRHSRTLTKMGHPLRTRVGPSRKSMANGRLIVVGRAREGLGPSEGSRQIQGMIVMSLLDRNQGLASLLGD